MCLARNADEKELAVVTPTLLSGLSATGAVIRALLGFSEGVEAAEAAEVTEAIGATTAVAAADAFFRGAVMATLFLGITGAVGLAGSAAFAFGATSSAFDVAAVVEFPFVGLGACLGGITCSQNLGTVSIGLYDIATSDYSDMIFGKRFQAANMRVFALHTQSEK